jgi:hypothetical protein
MWLLLGCGQGFSSEVLIGLEDGLQDDLSHGCGQASSASFSLVVEGFRILTYIMEANLSE